MASGTVTELFAQAVDFEQGGKVEDAIALYEDILAIDSKHAESYINLGTIAYKRGDMRLAERMYRQATEADDSSALAFYDLGNALDELRRFEEAVGAYKEALRLSPKYADAHYNLAYIYERTSEQRRALIHWRAYLKLNGRGLWAENARVRVAQILKNEKLQIVYRAPGISAPVVQEGA
jgi:tetratricopeptide (TPR) repeat protein